MTKKERIKTVIAGGEPDTVPYSFWSHFPTVDRDPEKMAETTIRFYREYDIDFIKTMNNGMYAVEDFGCTADYSEIKKGGAAKIVTTPIHSAADWKKLQYCSVKEGSLARELYSLRLILEQAKKDDVPVLFTIFSPVSLANKLCEQNLRAYIDAGDEDAICQGLDIITEVTGDLAREAIRLGADGIFFASQMSSYDMLSEDEYLKFGKPYDLRVLEQAKNGWFNTLHAHGENIMFELLKDYPVQVFNWHVGESLPTMKENFALTGKCLMGGIKRWDITNKHKNEVRSQIFETYQSLGMKHRILTPGCVIRHPLDKEMLQFVKTCKQEVETRWKSYCCE